MVQKLPFFELFFKGKRGKKNVFYDNLEEKNAFQGFKNKKFKKTKNWHFSNFFLLGNIGQENVFYDILQQKNVFLRYKNKKFKKSKNWHHAFDTMLLVQKWSFFQLLFLGQYRAGKCLLRYCGTKKSLSRYKNKKFKKSKNWHFSKGVKPWFWFKNGHFSTFLF